MIKKGNKAISKLLNDTSNTEQSSFRQWKIVESDGVCSTNSIVNIRMR